MTTPEPNPSAVVLAGVFPPAVAATALEYRESGTLPGAGELGDAGRAIVWLPRGQRTLRYSDERLDILLAGNARWRGEPGWIEFGSADAGARLAAAWTRHGRDTLAELNGPFLVLVVDRARAETTAAIDRFGSLALTYALAADGRLIVSSSAPWVSRHPAVRARLAPQALFDYVHFHMVPSPTTVFAGVAKLEPAQSLTLAGGRIALQRYWEPQFATGAQGSFGERCEGMLAALDASVRRNLSDGTATFLSGGIDSSTVTGLAVRAAGRPVDAFSMGFEANGYDESQFAQISAAHFGASLRQFYVTPDDVRAELGAVAAAFDEPFGNSSAIPTLLCARRARSEGHGRMLAGDGGDELFGGNTRYAKQQVFELYHGVPRVLRAGLLEPLFLRSSWPDAIPGVSKVASYVRQASMPMPDRTESYNFLVRTPLDSIFEPGFLGRVSPEHPFELLRTRYAAAPTRALLDRMLYLDWKFTLADNDLRKVGVMCALAGVDVRYPWLDEDVLDFSTTLRPGEKVKRGELRWFAKRALGGFLPEAVIRKTKHGFGLPFGEWLKTSPALQEEVYRLLRGLGQRGIVRMDFLTGLIESHRGGHAAYFGSMVWVLAMLEAWLASHGAEL